jgi:hypothetical protein
VVLGVLGQRIAPGLMDRYVANRAWVGQQSEDPEHAGRPDSLESPVAVDVAAHGTFNQDASPDSALLWAEMHRGAVAAAALGVGALALGLSRFLRRA